MTFEVQTQGHTDVVDITAQVAAEVQKKGIKDGLVTVFVKGSTAAISTLEYESGVIADLKAVLEKIAPEDYDYQHHQRWGDHNGSAHIRSALMGTDCTIPVENGEMALGTWQQLVLIDFDERPRRREIIVKISGN